MSFTSAFTFSCPVVRDDVGAAQFYTPKRGAAFVTKFRKLLPSQKTAWRRDRRNFASTFALFEGETAKERARSRCDRVGLLSVESSDDAITDALTDRLTKRKVVDVVSNWTFAQYLSNVSRSAIPGIQWEYRRLPRRLSRTSIEPTLNSGGPTVPNFGQDDGEVTTDIPAFDISADPVDEGGPAEVIEVGPTEEPVESAVVTALKPIAEDLALIIDNLDAVYNLDHQRSANVYSEAEQEAAAALLGLDPGVAEAQDTEVFVEAAQEPPAALDLPSIAEVVSLLRSAVQELENPSYLEEDLEAARTMLSIALVCEAHTYRSADSEALLPVEDSPIPGSASTLCDPLPDDFEDDDFPMTKSFVHDGGCPGGEDTCLDALSELSLSLLEIDSSEWMEEDTPSDHGEDMDIEHETSSAPVDTLDKQAMACDDTDYTTVDPRPPYTKNTPLASMSTLVGSEEALCGYADDEMAIDPVSMPVDVADHPMDVDNETPRSRRFKVPKVIKRMLKPVVVAPKKALGRLGGALLFKPYDTKHSLVHRTKAKLSAGSSLPPGV